MANKKIKTKKGESRRDSLVDAVQRIGVGLLYAATDLGQNSIAQILGMSDRRVNGILKGIKKQNKKTQYAKKEK